MSIFRRGQHADRLPIETRPVPPDTTHPFAAVTLLQDPPVTSARPALPARRVPLAIAAPPRRHGPASLPPLQPMAPARPRAARAPVRPPPPRITQPAVLACPGGQVPAVLTLPCATCHRVHDRGATSSFAALYTEALLAGWRKDTFGAWACPPCQAQPGWRAPCTPVLCREYPEYALIRDVAARAVPRWRWRKALRNPRVLLDAKALRALRA